jgi:cytochrome d ubiquinol oxidase subunit II
MNAIQLVCLVAAIALYVLADGFALGIGLLVLLGPRQQDRDAMVKSIASIRASNGMWLGVAGLMLALAFPFVLVALPSSYLAPLAIMAFALLARGAAFRFRLRSYRLQRVWEFGLAGASALAILCQGFILAGLAHSLKPVVGLDYIFALLCAAMLLGGYVLLGAGWLIWRASAPMQTFGREVAPAALILVAGGTAVAFAWALLIARGAFALRVAAAPLILLLGTTVCVLIWRSLWSRRRHLVFMLGLALFAIGLAGLADGLWGAMDGSGAVASGGVVELAVGFCVGAVLVVTSPIAISQILRGGLEPIDANPAVRLIPGAGCRRSQSLPTELHFS